MLMSDYLPFIYFSKSYNIALYGKQGFFGQADHQIIQPG